MPTQEARSYVQISGTETLEFLPQHRQLMGKSWLAMCPDKQLTTRDGQSTASPLTLLDRLWMATSPDAQFTTRDSQSTASPLTFLDRLWMATHPDAQTVYYKGRSKRLHSLPSRTDCFGGLRWSLPLSTNLTNRKTHLAASSHVPA